MERESTDPESRPRTRRGPPRALVYSALLFSSCAGCFGVFNLGIKVEMCRGKQAEARVNLKAIDWAEHDFHGRFGRYTDSLQELGFYPESSRTTYVLGFSAGGADRLVLPDKPMRPVTESDLPRGMGAGKDHFRAGAAGHPNSRSDELDVWTIDETGQLQHLSNPCVWTRFHMFAEG